MEKLEPQHMNTQEVALTELNNVCACYELAHESIATSHINQNGGNFQNVENLNVLYPLQRATQQN